MIQIFIGYDQREAVAYHVCCQSILDYARWPVAFHPVTGPMRDGSNAFIYERFMVPWMTGFRGRAIFLDGDMIVRGDISDLWACGDDAYAVQVVKHDYRTKHPVKYLGNKNEDYPRKNWSSVVVWNCAHEANRVLTPSYVEGKSGSFLHRFGWLEDSQIGALPDRWNRLVMEQEVQEGDRLLHYTIGTPCFSEYADCDRSEEWHDTLARALEPIQR